MESRDLCEIPGNGPCQKPLLLCSDRPDEDPDSVDRPKLDGGFNPVLHHDFRPGASGQISRKKEKKNQNGERHALHRPFPFVVLEREGGRTSRWGARRIRMCPVAISLEGYSE